MNSPAFCLVALTGSSFFGACGASGGFLLPKNAIMSLQKSPQATKSPKKKVSEAKQDETLWEVYLDFLKRCEETNRNAGVDPHHDRLEWNHTLPQCLFGDLPFGQWLSLRQHALASCLQTLVFKKVCFCGWHKEFVPDWLWQTTLAAAKTELSFRNRNNGLQTASRKAGVHNPVFSVETRAQWLNKATESLRRTGKGFFDPRVNSLGGKVGGKVTASQKWEDPDHPELGAHNAGNLVQKQRSKGLPHGKENRRRVE